MKRLYPSHIILCAFLICFGTGIGYLVFSGLFTFVTPMSFIGLLFYIPTLLLGCAFPLYAGIRYLSEIIRGKDEKLYHDGNSHDDSSLNKKE